MFSQIQRVNVCLNSRHRRYRPDSPMQNRFELGLHGTRDEVVAAYTRMLELRYVRGEIRPSDLIEHFDNIEDCRCPEGRICTTAALEAFITEKLDTMTRPSPENRNPVPAFSSVGTP